MKFQSNINFKVKRLIIFLFVPLIFITYSFHSNTDNKFGIRKVVIDAGHGGKDPGCVSGAYNEKSIALSIALKLGHYIEKNNKDVKVIYTRTTDEFIELQRRAEIANENKADLFISIHCNSNPSSSPYGVESWVMGTHKSKANLEVAQKENASILLEDDYSKKYNGFDPNSPEAYIIFSLYQNAFLEKSVNFASKVEKQLKDKAQRIDRGVKQAGFLVLFKTTMPSILIETGFLSNPNELAFISSSKGQDHIASAIYRAFKEYKSETEGTKYKKDDADEIKEIPKFVQDTTSNEIVRNDTKSIEKKEVKSIEPAENKTITENKISKSEKITEPKKEVVVKEVPKKVEIEKPIKEQTSKEAPKNPVKNNQTKQNDNSIKSSNITSKENKPINIKYRVQVGTSDKKLNSNDNIYKDYKNIYEYFNNGLYKYTSGEFSNINDAKALMNELRSKKCKEAFIVIFNNDERITLEEVKKLKQK